MTQLYKAEKINHEGAMGAYTNLETGGTPEIHESGLFGMFYLSSYLLFFFYKVVSRFTK